MTPMTQNKSYLLIFILIIALVALGYIALKPIITVDNSQLATEQRDSLLKAQESNLKLLQVIDKMKADSADTKFVYDMKLDSINKKQIKYAKIKSLHFTPTQRDSEYTSLYGPIK
jgi:hypothetical protein